MIAVPRPRNSDIVGLRWEWDPQSSIFESSQVLLFIVVEYSNA